jgi:tetratricopeptide (TPR) repeat protein
MPREDYIATPKKPLMRRSTRRRLIIIAVVTFCLLVIGFFVARPIRNAVRAWQGRRHAERAFAFIDKQKWTEARNEAISAYQLSPNEPEAVRAIARLFSRAGHTDALEFWKKLAELTTLTSEDLRDEVRIALKMSDLGTANEVVQQLLTKGNQKTGDVLLAAEISARLHDFKRAAQLGEKALADPNATRADQLQAVLTLDTVVRNGGQALVSDPKRIDDRLVSIAGGNDQPSLDALAAIASRVLSAPAGDKSPSLIPVEELISKIDNHPLATILYKLVAVDLEISQQNDQRADIIQRAMTRWKKSSDEDLRAIGAWLYQHREFQRELEMIPLERATQSRELFLQHVDVLAALNRWDEIRKILESERYPLDPVIQNMYLARCYTAQGERVSADNNWQQAIENSAGDLTKLLMLASYAEKNGAPQVAATAYDAAVAVSPKSREAQLGRLRSIRDRGDTKKLQSMLDELLKIWPNDTNLQNDQAYVRLLLLPKDTKPDSNDLKSLESLAQKLVDGQPSSLPHRTVLALALLKENRAYSALALYRNLVVSQNAVSPSTIAVHAAVLAASGQPEPAKDEAKKIPPDKLLPEERELIKTP